MKKDDVQQIMDALFKAGKEDMEETTLAILQMFDKTQISVPFVIELHLILSISYLNLNRQAFTSYT